MAELTFVGAAGVVTGSKHLLTVGGKHIFIDCGMFQGTADVVALNRAALPVAADDIDAVVITHGHLDHVGYLPQLLHDGFDGTIYCTPATQAVMQIVLDDAANLQQELQERGFSHQRPYASPLTYDVRDVDRTMRRIKTVPLHERFDVAGAINATYFNAGHILGSAFVALEFEGKRVIFSGDVGRYNRPLLYDPEPIGMANTIVCESTYASQEHPPEPLDDLQNALLGGMARGGAIVIPAFAVERTQDILLAIGTLQARDERLAQLPIHLDSPMAEKVDALFAKFPDAHRPIPNEGKNAPFGVRTLTIHETTDQSKQLNELKGTYVIVSASGMASGGRILHHLHNHISDPKSTIVFTGFQSPGTLGYLLTHGMRSVTLYGDKLPVRATMSQIGGFSGHADHDELHRWLQTCTGKPNLYAVHGEPASAAALVTLAQTAFGWQAGIAHRGTTVTV